MDANKLVCKKNSLSVLLAPSTVHIHRCQHAYRLVHGSDTILRIPFRIPPQPLSVPSVRLFSSVNFPSKLASQNLLWAAFPLTVIYFHVIRRAIPRRCCSLLFPPRVPFSGCLCTLLSSRHEARIPMETDNTQVLECRLTSGDGLVLFL